MSECWIGDWDFADPWAKGRRIHMLDKLWARMFQAIKELSLFSGYAEEGDGVVMTVKFLPRRDRW